MMRSQKVENALSVIPAKAGIQSFHSLSKNLDPVFQRGDDFLRDHPIPFMV
jgi:hypothetical protein